MDKEVIHGEWIGKDVRVIDASNADLIGIEGLVVDETKHLLIIRHDGEDKRVPKHLTKFRIIWNGVPVDVAGDDILAPPEERIKVKR